MRAFFLVLCAALAPGMAQAGELLRVYQKALDNDTQLLAAEKARDAALEAKPSARGALLPQVTGTGEYAYERTEITRDQATFDTDGDGIPDSKTGEVDGEPYSLRLGVRQVVYNKQLWERLKQADHRVAAAEASYRSAQQGLALRTAEAFFNLLATADGLRFAQAENKAVERQLEQAKQRFDVGLSAITDVQEAQARYDLTVAQQIEAEQALNSAREAVAEITGSLDTALMLLQDEIPLARPDPADVQAWLKTAGEGNLDVIAAQINVEIAKNDVGASQAGHWPTLALDGSKSIGEQAGFTPGEFDQDRIALQLNVPIYSGGTTQSGVRAAERTHEQRLAQLEGAKRAAERRTRDAYQGVIAGISRVKALNQAVVSNTTALEASEVGLQVGTRTAVDVLNAQRELYRAQRDYARARYDYLLNVLRLKLAAGRLGEQDLTEIDRLLTTTALELAH